MVDDWVRLSELIDDDASLIESVRLAVEDPTAYFAQHEDDLADQGVTSASDIDPWLILIGGLDEAGALAYLDTGDGAVELSDALTELPRLVEAEIELDEVADDIDADLETAIAAADDLLEPHGLRILFLAEDPEAFPLVVVARSHVEEILTLIARLGHVARIFG